MCSPELWSSWATRVRVMKCDYAVCNSVRAVFVGVLFALSVGWLEVFLQATEAVLTAREIISPIVRAWRILRIPVARLPMGLVPIWRRWRSRLQVGPRSWRSCLQVSPRPFVEPPTCFWVIRVVMFFVALKLLSFFAVLFVDCEEWFCILLGSLPSARHAIVCTLFSLEQSRVVDWVLPRPLCIYR